MYLNEIFKAPINPLLFEFQLSLELILLFLTLELETGVGTSHSEFRDILYTQEEGTVSFT